MAEVKIQKPMPKSTGVKVPYFCFVVFEDASSAQLAIEKKVGFITLKKYNSSMSVVLWLNSLHNILLFREKFS